MATKPRGVGGGAKGLSGQATKKITFFAASLTATLQDNFKNFISRKNL